MDKITVILPSKNRAAQLHLLMESIQKNAPFLSFDYNVIYTCTDADFDKGYEKVQAFFPEVSFQREVDFQNQTQGLLKSPGEFVCFFTDDCIFYRDCVDHNEHILSLFEDDSIWCFSYRLGLNTIIQDYTTGRKQEELNSFGYEQLGEYIKWNWKIRSAHDNYGYNFSWDGHIYRKADIIQLIGSKTFNNPRSLESMIVQNIKSRRENPRKYMAALTESTVVVETCNVVQVPSIPAGLFHPYSAEFLNEKYLDGKAIDLAGFDFSKITSSHIELPISFRKEK